MITNLVSLPNGNWGKLVGDALYCSYGTCTEDAEYDVANIYDVVGVGLMAEGNGMLFSVGETNWTGPYRWNHAFKRGRHSRSNNKLNYKTFQPIELDELPF